MKTFISGSLFVLLFMSLLVPYNYSDELDVINSFYNGLADIIEQNRANPDECVQKAEEFIRNNAKSLTDAAKSAQEREVTDDDVARMMNQPPLQTQMTGMNAMQRFSLVFGIFSQKYPEHAAKIMQLVSEFEER